MPELFIITADWNEQAWYSTGGTRAKKYLQAPDGKFYYFKRSQFKSATENKPGKDFKFEFWNEIIAFEIGSLLGFDMLRYDIAVDGSIMGCISMSMINSENEELIEGIKYLQAYSPQYDPSKKECHIWYTFDLIKNSLVEAKLDELINNIVELIIFDSLIGNGDRHQENWAIITRQILLTDYLEGLEKENKIKLNKLQKKATQFLKKLEELVEKKKLPKSYYYFEKRFAPIYDNGSSLGRELLDTKVLELLQNPEELERYISRGLSEIHWNGGKMNHFELIQNLLNSPYRQEVEKVIKRVVSRFDGPEIARLVSHVDDPVPEEFTHYKIPELRKQLIINIITLRFEKLRQLVS